MDPYQWAALVELCELGATIDVKALYPVTQPSQEGKGPVIDIEKPEGKSRSLFHDQQNEENNPPCNDCPYPLSDTGYLDSDGESDAILNISTALHQANLSYTKRLYSLKLGESLMENESCTPPPHSGLSLGLSSHAYRLPFGTPSSISSPLVDQHQQLQASQAQHNLRHLDAQRSQLFQNYSDMVSQSGNGSHLINSFSNVQTNMMLSGMEPSGIAMSERSGVEGQPVMGKNLYASYFANSISEEHHHTSHSSFSGFHNRTTISSVGGSLPDPGDPRATLFATPGLTPIYGNGSVSGMHTHSYTLNNSSIGKGRHLALNEESDIEVDDINSSMHLEESMVHAEGATRLAKGKSDTSRRVSFGPNATQVMDQFAETVRSPDRQGAASSSTQRKVIEGESPYKLQRQGSSAEQSDVDIAVQRHHVQAAAAAAGDGQMDNSLLDQSHLLLHDHASIDPLTPQASSTSVASPFPVMSSPIFSHNYSAIEPGSGVGGSHLMHTVTPAANKKKSHIPRRMLNSGSPVPATPSGGAAEAEDQQHHPAEESSTPMVDNASVQLSPARANVRKTAAAAVAPVVSPTAKVGAGRAVSPKNATTARDRNAITSPERRTMNTRASEKSSHAKAAPAPPAKTGGAVTVASAAPTAPTANSASSAVSAQDRSQAHSILVVFARAYQFLCLYKCEDCVKLLQSQLPLRHFKSGFAQHCVGKAYCESNQYRLCILAYKEMLKVEPFRVQGLEILSTALWFLKKDKELAALAQQVCILDHADLFLMGLWGVCR